MRVERRGDAARFGDLARFGDAARFGDFARGFRGDAAPFQRLLLLRVRCKLRELAPAHTDQGRRPEAGRHEI